MKKYFIYTILYILSVIAVAASDKITYEYPKNPHEADSLMEIYYSEIFSAVDKAINEGNSRDLGKEWIRATWGMEDAIEYASKPLNDSQIDSINLLIEKMKNYNLEYGQIIRHVVAPHVRLWGSNGEFNEYLLENIYTSNADELAWTISCLIEANLKNESMKEICCDLISYKSPMTNFPAESINDTIEKLSLSHCTDPLYVKSDENTKIPQIIKDAFLYSANVFPDDPDLINAVIDGMIKGDSLGFTPRWHLRYLMDNKYIKEFTNVDRKIANELLRLKYESLDNEQEKFLIYYSMISTHQNSMNDEAYDNLLSAYLKTDIPVLREFTFNEIKFGLSERKISEAFYQEMLRKIDSKIDSIIKINNININETLPEAELKKQLEMKRKYYELFQYRNDVEFAKRIHDKW